MNADFIRQTVNTAGTILVNSRTTFHFELNGKTSEQCRHLEMVLQYLASVSGSKMYQGIAHPLTQSPGTLSLEVNISDNNPQRKVAEHVMKGLYSSNNCYVYEAAAPQPAFMRAVNSTDYQLGAEFLGKCRRVLPNTQGGFKWGLTLSEEIEDACALTAHFPDFFVQR